MNYEGNQDNIDPNLVLIRSFKNTPDLVPKPITFDKEPDTSIDNDQNKKLQYENDLIPEIGDIGVLALCLSLRIRTPSDKAFEDECQDQNRQVNSTTGSFKQLTYLFTMIYLVST